MIIELIAWFVHGAFAGGFAAVMVRERNMGAIILFLLFFISAIAGNINYGLWFGVPNVIGFICGYRSMVSSGLV